MWAVKETVIKMRYGSSVRASSLGEVNLQGSTRALIGFTAHFSAPVTGIRWISKLSTGYAAGTGGTTQVRLQDTQGTTLGTGQLVTPISNNPGVVLLFPLVPLTTPTLVAGWGYELFFTNVDTDPLNNWNSLDGCSVTPDELDLHDYPLMLLDANGQPLSDSKNLPLIEIVYANGRSQGLGYVDVLISKKQALSAGVAERFIPHWPHTLTAGAIALDGFAQPGTIQLAMGSWPPVGQQIVESVPLLPPSVPGGWSAFYFSQPRTVDNSRVWWLIPQGTASAIPVQKGYNPGGFGPDTIFQDGYATVNGQPLLSVGGVQTDLQFYLQEV